MVLDIKQLEIFKGGSLSSTSLMTDGKDKFVRKTVSIDSNREYGYQRWYSQLKKQQRYNVLFPGTFPEIFRIGLVNEYAYFDMEYMANFKNAHSYLITERYHNEIEVFLALLIKKMDKLHLTEIPSSPKIINLYAREVIVQKIIDCLDNKVFSDFASYDNIVFCGESMPSFLSNIVQYCIFLNKYYTETKETLTHGNITLENLMYDPIKREVIFIDPYEENVIDTRLGEYGQLLQSCNSKYELYNAVKPEIKGNVISASIREYDGLDYFNKIYNEYLLQSLTKEQYYCVKLFEIAQFIHMLPFKMSIDENKMIFFYGLASKLLNDFMGAVE